MVITDTRTDTLTAEPVTAPPVGNNDWLDHYYCCDPTVALCGSDLTAAADADGPLQHPCVVCDDLALQPACAHGIAR